MSVNVVKDKGVTVITVTADKTSMLPPLCQVLKALCYSPMCCSVNRGMVQTSVTSALGVIQIMVGLFNIGLGPGRISFHPEDFSHLGVAYWLGGVFLFSGLVSVIAGQFPSSCSMSFAVSINIVGAIFSIVGIVMYSIDMKDVNTFSYCGWELHDSQCDYMESFYKRLLFAVDITMIVLAALLLCVCISYAVLGIKGLINTNRGEGSREGHSYKRLDVGPPQGHTWESDPPEYQPILKEVILTNPK